MKNADVAISMLKRLRTLGVQLGIDDFGAGYSSLSYLHRLPLSADAATKYLADSHGAPALAQPVDCEASVGEPVKNYFM